MLAVGRRTRQIREEQNDQIAQSMHRCATGLVGAIGAGGARNKGLEVDFKTSQGQDAGTARLRPQAMGSRSSWT